MTTTLPPAQGMCADRDPRMSCHDCGCFDDSYMVWPEVWRAAWPEYGRLRAAKLRDARERLDPDGSLRRDRPREFKRLLRAERIHFLLCFNCLELRLGRRLEIDDFTEAGINRAVRLGFQMGRRRTRRGTRRLAEP